MEKATSKYEMSRETEALFDFYKSVVDLEYKSLDLCQTAFGEEYGCIVHKDRFQDKFTDLEKDIFDEIQSCVWDQLMKKQDGEKAIII